MKQVLILFALLLITSFAFADTTPPVTTFSSFQVPNTTDQNITLTCTDDNTGCQYINYNVNAEGWVSVFNGAFGDLTDQKTSFETGTYNNNPDMNWDSAMTFTTDQAKIGSQSAIIPASARTSTTITSAKRYVYLWKYFTNVTNGESFQIQKTNNTAITGINWSGTNWQYLKSGPAWQNMSTTTAPINNTWYLLKIDYTNGGANAVFEVYKADGTLVAYQAPSAVSSAGDVGKFYVDSISTTYMDGLLYTDNNYNALNFPIELGDINSYSFLYSGVGDHNIQYFSTDNSDNNETTKTSTFKTYGNARFRIKDQNSGLDLNGTQINFNGSDYVSGSNIYDFNLQELTATNTPYLFTISKTGYSTRYYQIDLNYFSSFDTNFALLPDSLDSDVPFKVYQTDETTIFSNTYVEVKDSDTNWTVGRLKTSSTGEATFNLRTDDSNYISIVNNGEFTYSPVTVTVLYPKNEETLAQITEKWKIEITQNLYASYSDLNANKIIYLLPNTALPYNIKISDMNGNYFPRTYSKVYPGNPLTDTLQPYLVSETTGLLTTINTIDATTLKPVPNITIKIYKFISGLGRTFVEQITTDSKGQSLILLVLAADYEFEIYEEGVLLRTDGITATSSSIDVKIPSEADQHLDGNFYFITTAFLPNKGKLFKTDTDLNQTITLTNSGLSTITITSIQIWITNQDKDFNFYNESIPPTGLITRNSVDLNSTAKTIDDVNYDGNTAIYVYVRIVTSDGNVRIEEKYYGLPSDYSITAGLGVDLKTIFGCTTSSDPLFPCPIMILAALFLSLIFTIGLASMTGYAGMETMGVVFLAFLGIFAYLTWIPYLLYGLMILVTVVIGIALGGNRV